jgi:hypothetical protein
MTDADSSPSEARPPAAEGAPGLDAEMLDRVLAAHEWVLGIQLSDTQREHLRAAVIADVTGRGAAALSEYEQAVALHESVSATDERALAELRQQVGPQVVRTLRRTQEDATDSAG